MSAAFAEQLKASLSNATPRPRLCSRLSTAKRARIISKRNSDGEPFPESLVRAHGVGEQYPKVETVVSNHPQSTTHHIGLSGMGTVINKGETA